MGTRKQEEAIRRIAAILRNRGSSLASEVERVADIRKLSRPVREKIVDELGQEFAAKGLRPDSEPNEYGLEIEALTDACGLAFEDSGNSGDSH